MSQSNTVPFNNWSLIATLNEQLKVFVQLLERERQSLTLQKVDEILKCVDEKNTITNTLNNLVAQLQPYSLEDIMSNARSNPQAEDLASNFKSLSELAQTNNERNQTLLAALYKINGQLLNAIEQHSQPSFKGYSPSGQPSKQSRHRSLGEA